MEEEDETSPAPAPEQPETEDAPPATEEPPAPQAAEEAPMEEAPTHSESVEPSEPTTAGPATEKATPAAPMTPEPVTPEPEPAPEAPDATTPVPEPAETPPTSAVPVEASTTEEAEVPHPVTSPTVVMVFPPLVEPEFTVSDPVEFFGADLPEGEIADTSKGAKTGDQADLSKKTFPFRARDVSEAKIIELLRKVPPRHEYFGYVFSSQSQRPPNYYNNYFLPVQHQPSPKQHIQLLGADIPAGKIHSKRDSPKNAIPLSTIKVMWGSNKDKTIYKLEDIYAYLTRFGPIDGVYPISVNSCLVVFCDLEAARAAVMCRTLGSPWDPLIAQWIEPRMHNYGFYFTIAEAEKPPIRVRV